MTALDLILLAGATARLARLVTVDSWPLGGLRTALSIAAQGDREPWAWLSALVSCPWCVSVWLATAWLLAWCIAAVQADVVWMGLWRAVSIVLTASLAAGLVVDGIDE